MRAIGWMQDLGRSAAGKVVALLLALAMVFSYSNIFVYSAKAFAVDEGSEVTTEETTETTEEEKIPEVVDTVEETTETENKTPEGDIDETTNYVVEGEEGSEGDVDPNEDITEPEEPYSFDEATGNLTIDGNKAGITVLNPEAVAEIYKKLGISSSDIRILNINNVKSIQGETFKNLTRLSTLTLTDVATLEDTLLNVLADGTVEYKSQAFQLCKELTSVTLNNVDYVGREAFNQCSKLADLNLNGVREIGISAFSTCLGLTSLNLDAQKNGIKVIGNTAFSYCYNLENVTLSGNFESLGSSILRWCQKPIDLTIKDMNTIYQDAFRYCDKINNLSIENVGTIGQYAFGSCIGLEKVTINSVNTIDNCAFWYCSNLSSIDSLKNVKDRIGGFAFSGCNKLVNLLTELVKDEDFAAKLGFNSNYGDIMDRVIAILNGQFVLDSAEEIKTITGLEGWDDTTENRDAMWQSYANGTQVIQQARWANEEATVAEVKVDAYFTAQQQMDYVFVADLSASMAYLGNASDENARFYDMQSKLYNMVSQLMDTKGYSCNVSIVTFGGYVGSKTPGTATSHTFESVEAALEYIKSLKPLNENTDYKLGLNKTLELLQDSKFDPSRSTSVVFLSDGRPTYDGNIKLDTAKLLNDYNAEIAKIAAKIKAIDNVDIYGVLHSPSSTERAWAQKAMQSICSNFWESTDTESFGKAMNKAFTAKYPTFTITIPVGNDFENVDRITTSASSGDAYYDATQNAIVWTMDQATPFTKHTLSFFETLKQDRQSLAGTFDFLNNGAGPDGQGAYIAVDGKRVNSIRSTVLSRTYIPQIIPAPGTDTTTTTTTTITVAAPTLVAPAGPAPVEATPIEDDATPMAQSTTGSTEEPISDDENPLASVYDAPHCWIHYLIMLGMVLSMIYFAAVAIRRTSNDRKMGELERKLTEDREISYSASPAKHQA